MSLLGHIRDRLVRWQYARISRRLQTASPGELVAAGERKALQAFHRAARLVPAYRRILRQHGVDPQAITSIQAFKEKVPILDKETVFVENDLRDLCAGGSLDDVSLFYASSGHSGVFSFGVETRDVAGRNALALEFALQRNFRVLDRKTLLINCLPMGVKIHTRTLPLAETSVRPDVIWALIRKLRDEFDQFLLAGEHLFLKKVVEEGTEHGVPWKDLVVHAVTGAEYVAEGFRSYLASLLGIDLESPDSGMIGINFGLSELSLSIFSENFETLRIRRLAHRDVAFRRALYGRETTICPNIMQYYPQRTFIETVPGPDGRHELVVTMLDPASKLPLIRYNTRDVVETLSHARLAEILRDSGHESLLPAWPLPVGVVWGKLKPLVTQGGQRVYPEEVKEALYADLSVAAAVTGNFRLEDADRGTVLLVQLREGREAVPDLRRRLAARLGDYVATDVQLELMPYRTFPYGFDHDFERKNRYVQAPADRAEANPGPDPARRILTRGKPS